MISVSCNSGCVSTSRFAVLCTLSFFAFVHNMNGHEPAPNVFRDEFEELVSKNEMIRYYQQLSGMLAKADVTELHQMKRHANFGVALQAAWTQWVDDRRGLLFERSQKQIRDGITRWMGFVEGQLGVAPPERWCDYLKTGFRINNDYSLAKDPTRMHPIFFDSSKDEKENVFNVLPGLTSSTRISATRSGSRVIFRLGNDTKWEVDLASLEHVPLNADDGFESCSVDWYVDENHEAIVLRGMGLSMYSIVIRSRSKPEISWSSFGGGGDNIGARCGAGHDHIVYITANKDIIYVFGRSNCCVYVDGYDVQRKTRVGRFSSSFW